MCAFSAFICYSFASFPSYLFYFYTSSFFSPKHQSILLDKDSHK